MKTRALLNNLHYKLEMSRRLQLCLDIDTKSRKISTSSPHFCSTVLIHFVSSGGNTGLSKCSASLLNSLSFMWLLKNFPKQKNFSKESWRIHSTQFTSYQINSFRSGLENDEKVVGINILNAKGTILKRVKALFIINFCFNKDGFIRYAFWNTLIRLLTPYIYKYIRGAYDKFPDFFSYGHFYW